MVTAKQPAIASRAKAKRGRPSVRAQRQRRILDVAARLIQQKGYSRMSIRELAAEMDFAKGAFYYFVKNKEHLLYQIHSETLNMILGQVTAIVGSSEPPDTKLRRIVDAFVSLVTERPELFAIYFRERGYLEPEHRREVLKLERRLVDLVEKVYRDGVEQRVVRDIPPAVAVFGMLGMCFWTFEWFRPTGDISRAKLSLMLQELIAEGWSLRSRGPHRSQRGPH